MFFLILPFEHIPRKPWKNLFLLNVRVGFLFQFPKQTIIYYLLLSLEIKKHTGDSFHVIFRGCLYYHDIIKPFIIYPSCMCILSYVVHKMFPFTKIFASRINKPLGGMWVKLKLSKRKISDILIIFEYFHSYISHMSWKYIQLRISNHKILRKCFF